LPPSVDSVANACGSCHTKTAQLFANTRMKHRFEEVGLPGCATCHNEHLIRLPSDELLGMTGQAVCARCHEKGRYGATLAGKEAAQQMRDRLEELKRHIAGAQQTIATADALGMEVRGPRFDLRKATDALTNARVLVHSFSIEPVKKQLDVGFQVAAEVQELADQALQEYHQRRVWLAASLLPIVVAIGVLVLYIRSLKYDQS
jgi:predicted CXXCH cytochrome family protein